MAGVVVHTGSLEVDLYVGLRWIYRSVLVLTTEGVDLLHLQIDGQVLLHVRQAQQGMVVRERA